MTGYGGGWNAGTVYKLTPPLAPSTTWARTVLYRFKGGVDGAWPSGGLVADTAGALYGATYGGGSGGSGTIFRLTPPIAPSTAWTKTTLYSFKGGGDSSGPSGGLIFDSFGALYGAAAGRSGIGGSPDRGAVFKLTPSAPPATTWTKTIIHRFQATSNGLWPLPGGLIFDTAGALGYGAVFKLTSSIWPEWNRTTLHSFANLPDGRNPSASSSLVFDSAGALYGVTNWGGAVGSGFGAVYRLTPPVPPSTSWTESVLYSFKGGADGVNPDSTLIFDTGGALYGVAANGGSANRGAVFRLARQRPRRAYRERRRSLPWSVGAERCAMTPSIAGEPCREDISRLFMATRGFDVSVKAGERVTLGP